MHSSCRLCLFLHAVYALLILQVSILKSQLAAKCSEADGLTRKVGAADNLAAALEQVSLWMQMAVL